MAQNKRYRRNAQQKIKDSAFFRSSLRSHHLSKGVIDQTRNVSVV
jgi:hypothetical protein